MSTPDAVAAVLRIPTEQVRPGPNARGNLGDVTELAASLKALGQQIPVIVEPAGEGRWQLVDGHRRHAAATKARMPYLDAIVRVRSEPIGPLLLLRQLAMQAGARRFNPMDEAKALHTLMFEHRMTREQIAVQVGRSPAWVRDRIALTYLEPSERADIARGRMSVAEATLRLKNRREMRDGRPASGAGAAHPSAKSTRAPARETADRGAQAREDAVETVRRAAVVAYLAGAPRSALESAVIEAQRVAKVRRA